MGHQQQTIILKFTSAIWKLTPVVIILDYISIMVKEKDSINDFNIKSWQYKLYINNIDIIYRDINIKKRAYILSTKKIEIVIKSGGLEFICIQSKEIIKIDTQEESFIKTQESIKDKIHIHITIK